MESGKSMCFRGRYHVVKKDIFGGFIDYKRHKVEHSKPMQLLVNKCFDSRDIYMIGYL